MSPEGDTPKSSPSSTSSLYVSRSGFHSPSPPLLSARRLVSFCWRAQDLSSGAVLASCNKRLHPYWLSRLRDMVLCGRVLVFVSASSALFGLASPSRKLGHCQDFEDPSGILSNVKAQKGGSPRLKPTGWRLLCELSPALCLARPLSK